MKCLRARAKVAGKERMLIVLDSPNPVRHKDCGVIYEGELPKTFFYILPILNLRDAHASV
jgi:hypothetical protein